jgi:hypothetical protein
VAQHRRSQSVGLFMVVVFSAMFLWALAAVVWPVPVVHADGPPEILTITVTSGLETYFYDPGLDPTGGTVYFNSVGGEGGGQVITVTTAVSGSIPITLTGAAAFGITPTPDTNSTGQLSITYTIGIGAGTENGVLFTVTDSVGLTDTALITFTQDNAAPTVEFTDVTDPDHDSAGNELDDDGSNWYDPDHLSAGWHFTSTVTDTLSGLALANTSWDHSNDAYDQLTYNPGLDGDGIFNGVSDDGDGMVTVTLTLTDNVGNSASDLVVFNLDNTGPDIDSPFINKHDSPYLHVPGSTVIYYSHEMGDDPQPFDVEGFAQDDGVGLDEATYPVAFDALPWPDDLQAPPPRRFWSGTYTVDEDENEGDGSIQVTVSDLLGNLTYQYFFHIRDIAIPTVYFTDVTDPDYDPDGNELNTTGNWYRTGGLTAGWSFTSTVSDSGSGPGSADATWDHSMDNTDRSTDPDIDGDGVFTGVVSDGDGAVTVTLTITDNVGNAASDMLVIQLDGTAPSVPGNFDYLDDDTDSGGDGFLPETDYYDDTLIDLEWDPSTDDGSDLLTYHLGTAPQPTGGSYAEDSSYNVGSSGTYSIYLTAEDNVGNISDDTVAGPVVVDLEAPQVDPMNCPTGTAQLSFPVSWSATDPGSGLRSTDPYSVSYKVDGDPWQSWITATSATMATFGPTSPVTVAYEHTYCFRMRAVDKAGNVQYTSGSDCTEVSDIYAPHVQKVFLPIIMAPDPNWGFELGNFTHWQHGGELAQSVSTAMPHSGSYSALLGSPSYNCNYGVPVGSAWLSRTVTVPSTGSPTLSFWYRIYTHDINPYINQSSGYDTYDFFAVYINGSVPPVVKDANPDAPYNCSILRDLDWKQVNYDLSTYKGQTIQITFYNYNRPDTWGNTYTYVDDVSVQ